MVARVTEPWYRVNHNVVNYRMKLHRALAEAQKFVARTGRLWTWRISIDQLKLE